KDAGAVVGVEIQVLSSIATREAYLELVPQFEKTSGNMVATTWSGTTAIMKLMAEDGGRFDVVVISRPELDQLVRQGKLAAGTEANLAKSGIGVAVRARAPK